LIGHCKPNDAIYEHVERTTGIAPQSILFFDDLETNVSAATRRGWNARLIQLGGEPIAQIRGVLREYGVLKS
jgi:2-haloacid dehalogenase